MATQLFEDNATGQLAGALPQGATTLTLASGLGDRFPTPTGDDYFLATLYEKDVTSVEERIEIIKVTSRIADTWTIERDVGNKTGQVGGYSYPSNPARTVYVELRWTAYAARNVLQALDNLESVADPAEARENLGVVAENIPFTPAGNLVAEDVQVALEELDAEKQPLAPILTNISELTRMADSFTYNTGADTVASTALTPFARTILANTTATAVRGTIGLGNSSTRDVGTTAGTVAAGDHNHDATYQAKSVELTAVSALTTVGVVKRTGTGAYATMASTSVGEAVLTAADAAAARAAIGLGSVDNVSASSLRDRTTHTGEQAISTITDLQATLDAKAVASTVTAALALKAPIASPTFTGVPAAPTPTGGTYTTQVATTAFAVDMGAISTTNSTTSTGTVATTMGGLPTVKATHLLTGNTTFSTPTYNAALVANAKAIELVLNIRQGGTAYSVTWWSGVTWLTAGGTAPSAPTASKRTDYIFTYDTADGWVGRVGATT